MFNLVMKIMQNRLLEESEQVKLVLMEAQEAQQLLLVGSRHPVMEESMACLV
jgi:hypothetical protein